MSSVTVSKKGQVVIPAAMRKQLGITPGCQLDLSIDGNAIRLQIKRKLSRSNVEEGFGMLVCTIPGKRSLLDFEVSAAMLRAI